MTDFAKWLEGELLDRGWRPVELARRSGLDTGFVSHLLNSKRNAGPDACRAIAKALDYPEEFVFRKAGLLSAKPDEPDKPDDVGPTFWEWIMFYLKASEEEKDKMLEMAEELAEQNRREKEAAKQAAKEKKDKK